MSNREAFQTDLARVNAEMERAGAVVTEPDGFMWVDESKVSGDLVRAYTGLVQYGYANGLL